MSARLGRNHEKTVGWSIHRFTHGRILMICLWLFGLLPLPGQNAYPTDEQYKKRPTNAIAAIAQGKADTAIYNLQEYLLSYPDDAESHYCLTVAYSVKNMIPESMDHLRKAVDSGMPIERFIAGPKSLLKNLHATGEFQEFVSKNTNGLIHGPMLGSVTSSSAKIWFRTSHSLAAKIEVLAVDTFQPVKVVEVKTSPDGLATMVDLPDLKPATTYFYRIYSGDQLLFDRGTIKTGIKDGTKIKARIGFGGGAGYTPWFERMWDTLSQQSFDAFLLLGDNVYIDYPEIPEAQEYCYYRRQSRPEFRRFTQNTPIYAIWDDHDFTINDGEGGPEIEVPAWKRPVWNLFQNQWANPYYGGGTAHPGCWFDFSVGDIDFIMLDCRYYRENPKTVKDPSMLGSFQKSWLLDQLKNSNATFKILASSVPWAKNTKPGSDDTWDGFAQEREEIFSFIAENQITGVLLLAADRHRSDAWKITRPDSYDLYEFMSSRLTNIHTHNLMSGSLFGYNKQCSFGTLEFDTTADDPSVSYLIKNIDNEEIHKITIYLSQLDFDEDKVINKKGRN
ncbi:MAG: alkaline phosphatase [Saprospiraceae bacterium]|nr:alkaline phosphatase [Saprospiraceae bacterium]